MSDERPPTSFQTTNPATEVDLRSYAVDDEATVESTLETAAAQFDSWSDRPITERESLLEGVATVLRDGKAEYAELITDEVGKPIDQARSEVEKCAWVCEYYAERAGEYLQDDRLGAVPGTKTYVTYEPLGPVLAIMPWNYPFWQVFRFAAPHLTAGNVGVLKHAPNTMGCAQAITSIFREAGYPDGVFSSLQIPDDRVANVIRDDRIAAVTLTGSTRAGRAVAAESGEALKKTVLELGGSDPFVVLDDAPIETVAERAASARTLNAGQSCISAKRIVVHDGIADEFLSAFTREMKSLTVGDPADEATDIGPLARADLLEQLDEQVQASVEAGATIVTGGEPLSRTGYFYPPTVLTGVPDGCPAAEEELFGPVATVTSVPDEETAVSVANDSQYGLGASVWTGDTDRGENLVSKIEAGNVFVNQIVQSDPRLPFGGIKQSGYGSELSDHGIREFTNPKTVWVE
ncbi:NAD-dependent succinate-semialdehyde dehydrogenase [Haloarcula nitratireducens]|uniref:NAD-dependent succinate-semialdehyde dehydrogenase n=1 Tax=Haloarcula nitratireducens TaxID=2487749 RepID=A0AAW4PHQ2_9EURY|nr:NAD-dependent succinate-semialdehyde dehydrogenase [Halomicroarcula nitratireducens]MBX0297481.1 NAD-dependent succinate-semialdehyde dehydrogenase [Halomicroarcula nitratireducens]